jgi:hypothetical protein
MFCSRVCLGKCKEENSATSNTEAPAGYHSVKGGTGGSLAYPEYVIYDNDQQVLLQAALFDRVLKTRTV